MKSACGTLVTIAIPTLVRLSYLQEAVHSALAQSHVPIEVLISDDGSNDELKNWAQDLAARDSRVRYLRPPRRAGLAGNWNFCVKESHGQFVMIIGDDDRLLPDCVERLLALAETSEVVFSNHYLINSLGVRQEEETLSFTRSSGRSELPPGTLEYPEVAIWRNSVPISSALLRTETIKELGFKEDVNTPEIELYLRLAARGGRFVYCPDYLVEYRVHSHSATTSGLWTDKIASYLIPFPASDRALPYKRRLLEGLLCNAVGRAIVSGDHALAMRLWSSEFYPGDIRRSFRGRLQQVALLLPAPLGTVFYRMLMKFKI